MDWLWLFVALLAAIGATLRVVYAFRVDLHVDEFTTLWAARRILETGVPVMPSGVLYGRGLLTSYLTAGALALLEPTAFVGRLPSVLAGAASIIAIFAVGRREWTARVGLLAAVGLMLLPEAIDAAGRARFYGQLLLWTLLTLWAAYRMTRRPDGSWRAPLLMALFFGLALFTQAETVLLVPGIVLALLLWNGPRVLRHPPVWVSLLLLGVLLLARYGVESLGPVDSFDAVQSGKPYVGLFLAWRTAWDAYAHLFLDPRRIVWTAFGALAVCVAAVRLLRLGGRLRALSGPDQATLYFALQLASVGLLMATVVGPSWHDGRYILFVQPAWLLLGAAGIVMTLDLMSASGRARWAMTAAAGGILVWLIWPLTLGALQQETEGYAAAFAYVAQHRAPGDRVATPQPTACAWTLGAPCDYYARALDYAPYAVNTDAGMVDRWTGAKVLRTAADLRLALARGERVWLVTDRDRLASRYDSTYMQLILEQFSEVYSVADSMVLVADGLRTGPVYTSRGRLNRPAQAGNLQLADWVAGAAEPGRSLDVVLYWQAAAPLQGQINTSIQLVAADGTRISHQDGPPAHGWIPPEEYHDQPVPDIKRLALPTDLPDGWYRLEAVAYDAITHDPFGPPLPFHWFRLGDELIPPVQHLAVHWDDGITLTGVSNLPAWLYPGAEMDFTLDWQTSRALERDNTVFVHLTGPDGMLYAQQDKLPLEGFYPASQWVPYVRMRDNYTLTLPDLLPAGAYTLTVGWYDPVTGTRTLTVDKVDQAELARWRRGS
ncbi:MAG: glycosyltransferase family 39 protein [Caldilineaceae bacterium]|nr:glycosyltransferase family 39 protein [Caldilineaceae bacterium]